MITITITGDNAAEVFTELRGIVDASAPSSLRTPEKVVVVSAAKEAKAEPIVLQTTSAKDVFAAAVEAMNDAPVEAPKEKKPRKPKETAPVAAPAPVPSNLPASEEPTLDNARLWIKAVVASDGANGDAGGLEAAQKILTGLGVGKVSEMPAEKYNLLIADSKKFLTSKADIL